MTAAATGRASRASAESTYAAMQARHLVGCWIDLVPGAPFALPDLVRDLDRLADRYEVQREIERLKRTRQVRRAPAGLWVADRPVRSR